MVVATHNSRNFRVDSGTHHVVATMPDRRPVCSGGKPGCFSRTESVMQIHEASADDYEKALLKLRDDDSSAINFTMAHTILRNQVIRENATITPAELAQLHQWKNASTANLQYEKLAKQIATYLGYAPPKRSSGDKKPMWWLTLSTGPDTGEPTPADPWTMRPSLRVAMVQLKWDR